MMPVGVPKVIYRKPGSASGPEWLDVFTRLNRERIIFLGSEIDDELANQIIGMLLVGFTLFFLSRFILLSLVPR